MESTKIKLSYPWFANQYIIILSFISILVFVIYTVHLSIVQEDWRWLLIGLPPFIVLPSRIIDFYWCVYRAPQIIEVRDDIVYIEMRTKECFTINLCDIDRVEYIKRFIEWSPFDTKIVSLKLGIEWLLSSIYMRNVDVFIQMLRKGNQNCKIDELLLRTIARKSKPSINKSEDEG